MFQYGTEKRDYLFGAADDDILAGSMGSDFINGGAGSDWLHGGSMRDFLFGGAGADYFVFAVASPWFAYDQGVDQVFDFTPGTDHIVIGGSTITTKTTSVDAGAFAEGRVAAEADDRVLYNPRSGAVFYDADGAGGHSAIKIAKIDKHLDLSADDFLFSA